MPELFFFLESANLKAKFLNRITTYHQQLFGSPSGLFANFFIALEEMRKPCGSIFLALLVQRAVEDFFWQRIIKSRSVTQLIAIYHLSEIIFSSRNVEFQRLSGLAQYNDPLELSSPIH